MATAAISFAAPTFLRRTLRALTVPQVASFNSHPIFHSDSLPLTISPSFYSGICHVVHAFKGDANDVLLKGVADKNTVEAVKHILEMDEDIIPVGRFMFTRMMDLQVVQAVGGRVPVLFDRGIRRGTDVFKLLAFGAEAVLVRYISFTYDITEVSIEILRGWTGLRELSVFRSVDALDELRPGAMYQGARMLGE